MATMLRTQALFRSTLRSAPVLRWQPVRNTSSISSLSWRSPKPVHDVLRTNWRKANTRGLVGATALAGLGLGLTAHQRPVVLNDAPASTPAQGTAPTGRDSYPVPTPSSSVRMYELSFGTVCGICAGIFVKKGAKFIAFMFGGVFVLLQYFVSIRLIKVDWRRAESKFGDLFYSKSTDSAGNQVSTPPTVARIWNRLVTFLMADFQPRASFLAGMALGLRLG